jgi:hypothetical protein
MTRREAVNQKNDAQLEEIERLRATLHKIRTYVPDAAPNAVDFYYLQVLAEEALE